MALRSKNVSIDPEDENAVRSLLDRMADAWARGDARAYADCFTPDSDYVTYNGMHLRGREENAKLHQSLFSGVLKNTQINAPVENLAFLAPDVALVHTAGSTAKRGPSKSARRRSVQTFVIVKRNGQWHIRSFQNTRIRPLSVWVTRQVAKRQRA